MAPSVDEDDADDTDCEGAEVEPVSLWAVSPPLDALDGCLVVAELGFDEVAVERVEVEVFGVELAVDGLAAVEPASGVDGR